MVENPDLKGNAFAGLQTSFQDFAHTFSQYRQFTALVEAALEQANSSHQKSLRETLRESLLNFQSKANAAEVAQFRELIGYMMPVQRSHPSLDSETNADGTIPVTHLNEPHAEQGEIKFETSSPLVIGALMRVLKVIRRSGGIAPRQNILYQSVLTGLVGRFEVLIADLAAAYYKSVPASAGSQDPVISMDELLGFGTLEDAVDFIIEKKVDDLLRVSLDDWRKFFQSRMKVDITKLTPNWERFAEYTGPSPGPALTPPGPCCRIRLALPSSRLRWCPL